MRFELFMCLLHIVVGAPRRSRKNTLPVAVKLGLLPQGEDYQGEGLRSVSFEPFPWFISFCKLFLWIKKKLKRLKQIQLFFLCSFLYGKKMNQKKQLRRGDVAKAPQSLSLMIHSLWLVTELYRYECNVATNAAVNRRHRCVAKLVCVLCGENKKSAPRKRCW